MGIVAIFGGTFNPPHFGHRQMLEHISGLSFIDKILVIPTKIPPHKDALALADEKHRLEMCKILADGISKASVSDIELNRVGRSYTIDTLNELKHVYPNSRLAITIGADMMTSFDKWKDYEEILKLADIIAFYREGESLEEYNAAADKLGKLGANIHLVSAKVMEVSSSEVRNSFCTGICVSSKLQPKISEYIIKNKLYGVDALFNDYIKLIRANLDDYRYNHSLCVADEALRLAVKYNGDAYKAYVAGLLHDVTKNYSAFEHLKFAEKFDIMMDDIEKASVNLWHAITGSVYVREIVGIDDADIIGAIRYHTTAKADMTLLQKIVYLADFTSADRNYSDVDVMRRLVDENMDSAMRYSLNYTINDLKSRGLTVHPDTLAAFEEINTKRF